jgi:hypothetical protein
MFGSPIAPSGNKSCQATIGIVPTGRDAFEMSLFQ